VLSAALLIAAIVLFVSSSRSAPAEPVQAARAALVADVYAAEAGRPFIRNFSPAEYGAGSVNEAVTQDRQGMIYVGNDDDGVLAFDGSKWRRIAIPNLSAVRALATDSTGRVYVGAVGELGYLAPDESGQMHYVSLLDRIPREDRGFTDVWNVFPTDEGVYFATFVGIFRVRGDDVKVWKPDTSFHYAFWARGTLFVREVDRGLMHLVGDQFVPVSGGERFATEKIYALLPWREPLTGESDELLIGTRTQGWFIFDGIRYRRWLTEADTAIRRDSTYFSATWLVDGALAVGSRSSGVSLFDGQGRLLRHMTKTDGLPSATVNSMFQDRQRGLWLSQDNGVTRIGIGSPLTEYDDRTGLEGEGAVTALVRHAERLYAGTSQGVFRLDADGAAGTARFAPISGIPEGQTLDFLDLGSSLLAAASQGIFEIRDHHADLVRASEQSSTSLSRSLRYPTRVFVGLQNGVASMRQENARWVDEGQVPGVVNEVRGMFEEPDGRLWLGLKEGGVIRLTFPVDWPGDINAHKPVQVEHFGTRDGVSAGINEVYSVEGRPRFAGTFGGIRQFDENCRCFVPDPQFARLFPAESREMWLLHEVAPGRVWMVTVNRANNFNETGSAVKDVDGNYRWTPSSIQPPSDKQVHATYVDHDGVAWFGGTKLFRYDPRVSAPDDPLFTAMVRKVAGPDGHLVVAGTGNDGLPQIAHENNALRFEFAGPSFEDLAANRFQVLLEGIDRAWSAWSGETYRDYTNLPEGNYRFRVHARNVYGGVSAEASYAFSVLPPWYRTWWAKFGFAALIIAILSLFLWGLFWTRLQIVTARAGVLEERNRIAREMHDSLAQGMAGIAMQLQAVKRAQEIAPARLGSLLDRADVQFKEAMEETRRAILALRPVALERHGLIAALRELVSSYSDAPSSIHFHLTGVPCSLPDALELQVFRLAQEAIANAIQHANASAIDLSLDFGRKMLTVQVSDNGRGIDSTPMPNNRGSGLIGMRKRVAQLRGRIEIVSAQGCGTTLTIVVPRPFTLFRWRQSIEHKLTSHDTNSNPDS
jgi:signal transduction histidine kinase